MRPGVQDTSPVFQPEITVNSPEMYSPAPKGGRGTSDHRPGSQEGWGHPSPLELHVALSGSQRVAQGVDCTVCGSPLWVGWDGDFAALPAVADRSPLSDGLTEVALWLAGRMTYLLTPCNGGWQLDARSQIGYRREWHTIPAIVGEHCCEEHQ